MIIRVPKTEEQARKYLDRLIRGAQKTLKLQEWHFSVQLRNKPDDDDPMCIARINPDVVYLKGYIEIYPEFWNRNLAIQKHCITHELTHCLTAELSDLAQDSRTGHMVTYKQVNDAVERLTERITRLILEHEQNT